MIWLAPRGLISLLCLGSAQGFLLPQPSSSPSCERRHSRVRAASTLPGPPEVPFIHEDAVQIWPVLPSVRKEGAEEVASNNPGFVRFLSLEEVFGKGKDGTLLAETFDQDASFRRAIRVAMRDDLLNPDPKRSEKANEWIKDLGSSLMVGWSSSPTNYGNLTSVFQSYGLKELDGKTFIKKLGGMAGGGQRIKDSNGFDLYEQRFGSLIDIVNPGARVKVAHSFHQDSGLKAMTVMFGFPKTNGY